MEPENGTNRNRRFQTWKTHQVPWFHVKLREGIPEANDMDPYINRPGFKGVSIIPGFTVNQSEKLKFFTAKVF